MRCRLGQSMFQIQYKVYSDSRNTRAKVVWNKRKATDKCIANTSVDASIILTSPPYIIYEQFKLDDNFRTYLKEAMIPEHVLKAEIKPTPYRKSFELVTGTQSRVANYQGANKQFFFSVFSLCKTKAINTGAFAIPIMLN